MLIKVSVYIYCIFISGYLFAKEHSNQYPESIATTELSSFSSYPPKVQNPINLLLSLARQGLNYQYGSSDPKAGGMDCSGTMYYALRQMGIPDVPRSSDLQYQWVTTHGHFYAVPERTTSIDAIEFAHLRPGDLLFWSGTYKIERSINVTHVMMYLGKNQTGQPLMIGASNGRTYKGRKIYGVSVFDFKVPDKDSHGYFLGYGCVPNLNCEKI
ncbi:MAG: C40 family peptidase [Legionellaceae bacterium]|nr:C40 family peptidase [Legionellaceae bacterium]MBP9774900.1 C40 family peptidase [Legionellaceae bacterium]